jgi:hypothetical protein
MDLFLGENWRDVGCGSFLWTLDALDERELSGFSLNPYYPVWQYMKISEDVIYAFTKDR